MALYWPKLNIQCNTYEDFIKWSHNADFNLIHLPLKEEYRAKFDVEKAWKRYRELEGTPYGIQNFFFGWIDHTTQNLPKEMTFE